MRSWLFMHISIDLWREIFYISFSLYHKRINTLWCVCSFESTVKIIYSLFYMAWDCMHMWVCDAIIFSTQMKYILNNIWWFSTLWWWFDSFSRWSWSKGMSHGDLWWKFSIKIFIALSQLSISTIKLNLMRFQSENLLRACLNSRGKLAKHNLCAFGLYCGERIKYSAITHYLECWS